MVFTVSWAVNVELCCVGSIETPFVWARIRSIFCEVERTNTLNSRWNLFNSRKGYLSVFCFLLQSFSFRNVYVLTCRPERLFSKAGCTALPCVPSIVFDLHWETNELLSVIWDPSFFPQTDHLHQAADTLNLLWETRPRIEHVSFSQCAPQPCRLVY